MHKLGEFTFISHHIWASCKDCCIEKNTIFYLYIEKNYITSLVFLSGITAILTIICIKLLDETAIS